MNLKLKFPQGLDAPPFRDAPLETLLVMPAIADLCRLHDLSFDVGLTIVSGVPDRGKLAALRRLAARLLDDADSYTGEDTP